MPPCTCVSCVLCLVCVVCQTRWCLSLPSGVSGSLRAGLCKSRLGVDIGEEDKNVFKDFTPSRGQLEAVRGGGSLATPLFPGLRPLPPPLPRA